MSRTIDNKVVEMEFDNSNFEKNVSTSMGTLDKLKKSLNFDGATKGLENIERASNNVKFDQMASSLEALERRFSTLGIVGMQVIQNLTNSAINLAKKGLSFVTDGIVQGGVKRAMNLEQAHFQLQGLLEDEQEVAAVMQNVNDAVDGTAYGLDAAAKVASQLAASGMRAGDEMFGALRAVAGVAAMTNSDYESVGDIFTTVAGNGRLMGMQLTQLASRGLNAAATLAKYLNITEAEVRDMVSHGEIDFKTFASAMDDAFGEHAKKANETMTGALSNIRAALGRIGALFVSPMIEQNGPLVKLLNEVRIKINAIKASLVPFAELVTGLANKTLRKLTSQLNNIEVSKNTTKMVKIMEAFGSTIGNVLSLLKKAEPVARGAFKFVFPDSAMDSLVQFANHLKDVTTPLKKVDLANVDLYNTFKGLFSIVKIFIDTLKALGNGFGALVSKLTGVPGNILSITGAFGKWISEIVESAEEMKILQTVLTRFGDKIGSVILNVSEWVKENDKLETIASTIARIFDKLTSKMSNVGDFFRNIISGITTGLSTFFDDFNLGFGTVGAITAALAYNIRKVLIQIRKLFGDVNPIRGFSNVFGQLYDTLYAMEQSITGKFWLEVGAALLMVAVSMAIIGSIDSEKIGLAFAVITGAIIELMGALRIFESFSAGIPRRIGSNLLKLSVSVLIIAISLNVISKALERLSKIKTDDAIKAFDLLALSLGIMIAALYGLSRMNGPIVKGAIALGILSVALLLLAAAIGAFTLVANSDNLLKGLALMAGALLLLVGACNYLGSIQGSVLSGAASIFIISAALLLLAGAIAAFALITKMGNIVDGLTLMAVSILGLMAALTFLGELGPKILIGAGAMLVMSAALLVLAAAMGAFAVIASMDSAWEGLGLLAAAIVVLTAACFGLSLISAPVLIGAACLGVMSLALAAFGAALMVVSIALPMFTTSLELLAKGLEVISGSIEVILTNISEGMENWIANILTGIATGIEEILASVGEGIGKGLEGISKGLDAIGDSIGNVGDGVGDIGDGIERFGNGVRSLTGISWVSTAVGIKEIADALKQLNKNKFDGDVSKITEYVNAFNNMVSTISGSAPKLIVTGSKLSSAFGTSLVNGIRSYYSSAYAAGQYVVSGFINGINSKLSSAVNAAANVGSAAARALQNSLQIHSPSKVTEKLGKFFSLGFINQIKNDTKRVGDASYAMGEESTNSLKDALTKMYGLITGDIESSPVITPIIDLSKAKTGIKDLNGIISSENPISASGSVALAGSISNKTGYTDTTLDRTISKLFDKIQNGESGNTTNNVFNIHGDDPKTIAGEVSRILQAQVERRNASWA